MKIIGHRGAKGLAPENTIASFKKALELGVDELECDVRVTKDNIAVLHHDPTIFQGDIKINVHDLTYAELKALKPGLNTLEEAMQAIGHEVPLQIEVKPRQPIKPIAEIVRKMISQGWPESKLLFGSFDQEMLRQLNKEFPTIEKVVIERWSSVIAVRRAKEIGTKRISLGQRWLWWGVVRNLHQRGYKLCAYPVNTPRQGNWWGKNNIYGVITDYPDRFQK